MNIDLTKAERIGFDVGATGLVRLAIGLAQGLAAWLLLELVPPVDGYGTVFWAMRHPSAFAILALIIAFVPTVALAEIGRMRINRLLVYLCGVSLVLALLSAYDIWRDPLDGRFSRYWPSAGLAFTAGIGLFIANQLLEHRERGNHLYGSYPAHFEDSWMRAFQFIISLVFTLLFWGVLWLGKALFDLIHLEWFGRMIQHNWFHCPVLAIAFAAAVHITDVRPALLIGMRNLGLTLLSWLLPLVVLLGGGFIVALGFTGLAPLWATRFASTILLSAVAVMLVLLNAAYKDGDPAHTPVLLIRWAGRGTGPIMLIFALLATYAIALRVGQHGWTPQRVRSAAVAAMALLYGGGYTVATLRKGPWLQRLEPTNVTASLTVLGILALLLSPLVDPERVAVMSQLGRLHAKQAKPQDFDFEFLRFHAGRYGTDALARMATDSNAEIRSRSAVARAQSSLSEWSSLDHIDSARTEPALSHATVYPAGTTLPADFRASFNNNPAEASSCLTDGSPCDIIALGKAATIPRFVVHLPGLQFPSGSVIGKTADRKWAIVGRLDNLDCAGVLESLRRGETTMVKRDFYEIEAAGVHLNFTPIYNARCPAISKPASKPNVPGEPVAPSHLGPAFSAP